MAKFLALRKSPHRFPLHIALINNSITQPLRLNTPSRPSVNGSIRYFSLQRVISRPPSFRSYVLLIFQEWSLLLLLMSSRSSPSLHPQVWISDLLLKQSYGSGSIFSNSTSPTRAWTRRKMSLINVIGHFLPAAFPWKTHASFAGL